MDLTQLSDIKKLLSKHNLWAKKSLGQNFLIDRETLDAIVTAADLKSTDHVIEVGAGLGVLTRELAPRAKQVTSLEVDETLLPILKETLWEYRNVEVLHQNVLDFQAPTTEYKVVANIPYYITSKLLRKFLEEAPVKPSLIVFLVQKEVAEEITAKPGDLSILGVSVQTFGMPEIIRIVPRMSFYPIPNVDSAVLKVKVRDPGFAPEFLKDYFKLVHAGFGQRRKQLHNTLMHHLHWKIEQVDALLTQSGIDRTRRAQTLTLDEWKRLTENYLKLM